MIRGLTDVAVIWPNVADETFVFGFAKLTMLNALKNSARNSAEASLVGQPVGVRLINDKSMFRCAGPRMMPTPLLPKSVARPSAPITGHGINGPTHDVSKYRPMRSLTEPVKTRSSAVQPDASCARSPVKP